MKTTYIVTVGEYDNTETVAAFDSKQTADQFAKFIGGDIHEVPRNPPRASWEVWETNIWGEIRDGRYFPYSITSRMIDDPFRPETSYPYSADKQRTYSFNARGKTKAESVKNCKESMRNQSGFKGNFAKTIKAESDRIDAEREAILAMWKQKYGNNFCVTRASFDYPTSMTTGTIQADGARKEDVQ